MQFARMQNFNHCNSKMWIVLFGQDISHKGSLKSRLKYHIPNTLHNVSIIISPMLALYKNNITMGTLKLISWKYLNGVTKFVL